MTRLIGCYQQGGEVQPRAYRRHRFANRYTGADVELLAAVDEAHETLSGPATQTILRGAWHQFHEAPSERLAQLSVAQLYRLRKSHAYRHRRVGYPATRPSPSAIGERRKPDPQGRPGYLRLDTVHQGDLEGMKGLYHINAVDEVTQWQVVGATAQISEAWLLPVLEAMLAQFPFRIRGFHSDNGSEFVNHTVAGMLNKLLVEQTIATAPQQRQRTGGIKEWLGDSQTHVTATSARRTRKPSMSSIGSTSIRISVVRGTGSDPHRQRKTEARLPVVRDILGDLATVAWLGCVPAGGPDYRSVAASRPGKIRHPGRHGNAGSETKAVRSLAPQTERMRNRGRAVEMTGEWKTRKTKPRFPSFLTALGNRCAIPTFPPPGG